MTFEASLDYARRRDAADPLRDMRERFALPQGADGTPLIYLCGHSLGLQPRNVAARIAEELDDWARLAVLAHEHGRRPWVRYHEFLSDGLARLAGARPDEVVAMNSLTVNLHLMMATFYRPSGSRTKILIEAGAFASDRHAVVAQLTWHGLDPATHLIELAPETGADLVHIDAIRDCLRERGSEIALVLWPGIQFRTGQAFDLAAIAQAARAAGCRVGFDLAHAIGNLELALHDSEADFAVWCSYKYLNAGPGAIGGCFVHERHADDASLPRLAGWWGHELSTRFAMRPGFRPAHGAAGWAVSNPPIFAATPLLASLELFDEAGIERLRAKSVQLTGFLEFLIERLAPQVQIVTPRAPAERGCQLSLRIPGGAARGRRVFEWLGAHGAICDWREPDILRVAPAPLYNSFEDVFRFGELFARALEANP